MDASRHVTPQALRGLLVGGFWVELLLTVLDVIAERRICRITPARVHVLLPSEQLPDLE